MRLSLLGVTALIPTLLGAALIFTACSGTDPEARAREMAEKMKSQIKNIEQAAAEQKVDREVVKKAQEHLTKLHEYMGTVNGDLDMVTVNAIEAFQRSQDLKPTGLLDQKTVSTLERVAGAKG